MIPKITLSQAMEDPALFGGTFQAASFWTWKTVAKVIDGLPLTERREVALYEAATGRKYKRPRRRTGRFLRRVILLSGRRSGKDRMLSAVACWRAALAANWNEYLSPGEQAVVLLVGADRKQASILRRYCEGLLQAPLLAAEVVRRTDDAVTFRNGGVLEVGTNDARLIRGRSAVAVLGSECCYWKTDETSASSDEEVVSAAVPSMAMAPDHGLLVLGSSVYRKRGYMYRQYKRLHGNNETSDICWFTTSAQMNPRLPASTVADAIAADGPKGRAEFENCWREDTDDFAPLDIIEACTDWGVVQREPERGHRFIGYADAASGTGKDSFSLCICHAVNDEARTILVDLVAERKPRFVAADTIREFSHILRTYGVTEVLSDSYSAGFAADEWARNGIRFTPSKNTTSENFLYALPLLTSKRARLVDNVTLRKQFSGLQRRVVAGHEVVGHANVSSAHDDVAAAVAGCLVAANAPCGVNVTPEYLGRLMTLSPRRNMGSARRYAMPFQPPGGQSIPASWNPLNRN